MIAYELLKISGKQLDMLKHVGVTATHLNYLNMYEDYLKLRVEGVNYTTSSTWLAEKHNMSEKSAQAVIKLLSQRIDIT